MSEPTNFGDFIRRVRAGDEQAATELVGRYEPFIRREVRLRLEDRRLRRLFDSMDICQSVLNSFFLRVVAGQYDLERPEQLLNLLISMARNKLAAAARAQHQQRRDQRRTARDAQEELAEIADPRPGPAETVANEELVRRFRDRLSDEEKELADLRGQGMAWDEVAARLGGTGQARRMQLVRAIDRVLIELGVEPT